MSQQDISFEQAFQEIINHIYPGGDIPPEDQEAYAPLMESAKQADILVASFGGIEQMPEAEALKLLEEMLHVIDVQEAKYSG